MEGHKTAFFGYYACLLCDLLLMPSEAGTHTHTRTHTPTFVDKIISRNQVHTGLWLVHAWFKNYGNKLEVKKLGNK